MAESIVQGEDLKLLLRDDGEEETIDSETPREIPVDDGLGPSRFSIPLNGGKQYHLFIAHSDTDKEYANRMMEELEERFGFRCMFAERDFLPGKGIVENINEKVLQSQVMLLILTPEFKKSYYCNQEMNEAFRLAEQERRFNTILPLLTSTEFAQNAIPMALKSLTYIDAEKEVDVALKIHQMYFRMIESEQWPTDMNRGIDSLQQNGAVLLTVCAEKYLPSRTTGIRYEFKELSRFQKRSLKQDEFEVCKIYKAIVDHLNVCSLLLMYGIHGQFITTVTHSIIVGLTLSLILVGSLNLVSVFKYMPFINIGMSIAFIIMLAVFFTLLMTIGYLASIKMLHIVIDRYIWRFNRKLLKESPYIVAYNWPKPNQPRINIIRYDSSKCYQYLCVLLKSMHPELSDAEIEEKTTSKIENLLWTNRKQMFYWNSLPISPSNRHNVYMNKACFCEMVVSMIQEL